MEDGKVQINTEIDESGVEKGLKGITKKLNDFAKKLKSNDFANLGMSITGIATAFKSVTNAVKMTTNAIKDTTEAFKTQIKAETQLDNAVKNSPFMNGESAKKLKAFASEIQSFSTYGDETLIPFMAELTNAGRTETEIMDIMKTAVDIAASGMMDLGSAVSSLNMTFQGTTGTLGRQIASIKNLTTEELKSGKAIEILKKQFNGTAEEVAKVTGSSEQLKNAWGDLKEEIGASFEKNMTPMRKFFTELVQGWTDAKKKKREYEEADDSVKNNTADSVKMETNLKKLEEQYATLTSTIATYENMLQTNANGNARRRHELGGTATLEKQLKAKKDELELLKEKIDLRKKELEAQKKIEAEEKKNKEIELKTADEKKAKEDALSKSTDNYNKIIAKRDQTLKILQNQAKATGEQVDLQDILNAEMTAYLEMALDPNLPTKTKEQLEVVKELVKQTKGLAEAEEKYQQFADALNDIDVSSDLKKSEILKEQLETLNELSEAFRKSAIYEQMSKEERLKIWEDYEKKRKQLEKNITEAVEEETYKQKTTIQEVLSTINSFVSEISSSLNQITSLASDNAQNEATVRNAELEKQFKQGLISESEYYDKKEQIEKESARKQYELQMWEWSAGLIQIASSTAQAVANALTMKPAALGISMATIMGSLGAVQLANSIKNKPIPPSFASGGIVGGGAYSTNDNIRANVKTGEMILNQRQQQNLWRMAQGSGRSSSMSNNIQIKNYRGNDTKVTPQITDDGIKILIRESISDDLRNRRLNDSLLSANNTLNGISYE